MARTKQAAVRFSPQSQRIGKTHFDFTVKLKKTVANSEFEARKKEKAEADAKRQSSLVDGGQGVYRAALVASLAQIEESKRLIAHYDAAAAEIRAEIEKLKPTAEQAEARAATQEAIARLAKDVQGEIETLDGELDRLTGMVRDILAKKEQIAKLAEKIELTNRDKFQSEPFKELLFLLRRRFGGDGRVWLAWFLGNERTSSCTIREDGTSFDETLAQAHFYMKGDVAQLNDADFKRASYEPPVPLSAFELERAAGNSMGEGRRVPTFRVGDPNIRLPGGSF